MTTFKDIPVGGLFFFNGTQWKKNDFGVANHAKKLCVRKDFYGHRPVHLTRAEDPAKGEKTYVIKNYDFCSREAFEKCALGFWNLSSKSK